MKPSANVKLLERQHKKRSRLRALQDETFEARLEGNPLDLSPPSLDRVFVRPDQQEAFETLRAVGSWILNAMVWALVSEEHLKVGPHVLHEVVCALTTELFLSSSARRFHLHENLKNPRTVSVDHKLLADLFETYLAAAVQEHGWDVVDDWIKKQLYCDRQHIRSVVENESRAFDAKQSEAPVGPKVKGKVKVKREADTDEDEQAGTVDQLAPQRKAKRHRQDPPAAPVEVKPPSPPSVTVSPSSKSGTPAKKPPCKTSSKKKKDSNARVRIDHWAARHQRQLVFRFKRKRGDRHSKSVWKAVVVEGLRTLGSGEGDTKRAAARKAAEEAILRLGLDI